MGFTLLAPTSTGPEDARFDETLIDMATTHGPTAAIWTAKQGLVVPRTYRRHTGFEALCAEYALSGWPVTVRMSGGGIVPQGPGIINVSLAYCIDGNPMDNSEAAYQLLCNVLGDAIARMGVQAHAAAVEGSFCDGRYNLAIGQGEHRKKVAGTAQLWRRYPTPGYKNRQAVLVHALVLACVDTEQVTHRANEFEQALGTDRRYLPGRTVSLHTLVQAGHAHDSKTAADASFLSRLHALLEEYITGATLPPGSLTVS
ncbi:lipoate--protein ligase family protein [Pusillimonas sp. ANT_WB101]|uniref:lipoyl protein ligase domain-containing protein n=1 Tax=Pusillimonas sp. ANT_WB101 TaxID=2597356 RepID=UPI0011EBE35A|nr:lipoate--protein ligase family protein [Pusillimonas sp. ANT_WB101]KAA0910725.1 lipoate--protein ligase family protein [Pusillimonas sp. ANT_WB101]